MNIENGNSSIQEIILESATSPGKTNLHEFTLPHNRFHAERMAVLTGDMESFVGLTLERIFGENLSEQKRDAAQKVAKTAWSKHKNVVADAFPGRGLFFSEEQITNTMLFFVARALNDDPKKNRIVAYNDRYSAPGLEDLYNGQVFRFNSTRVPGTIDNNNGDRTSISVPRAGEPPFDQQLTSIEDNLAKQGKSLVSSEVVIADDTTATNGTEKKIAMLFKNRNATVNPKNSIYSYVIFIDGYDPNNDRPNSAGISEKRTLSAEQRELGPLGGPTTKIGKRVAFQEASQAPWGDGTITRIDGFINQPQLDERMLQIFIDTFEQVERGLDGTKRQDGLPFTKFTLADFRWMIPSSPYFGPSNALRQYRDKTGFPPRNLGDIGLLDYVKLALENLQEHSEKPTIERVVLDLDGTVLEAVYDDPLKKSFLTSSLGKSVTDSFKSVMTEFVGGDSSKIKQVFRGSSFESPTQLLKAHPMFAAYLEQKYGEFTSGRLVERFNSFYGAERGREELERFLHQYDFLPLSYHVLRELTWGQVDIGKVYKEDENKDTARFVERVLNRGGKIVILTAGPKIHAMKMIEKSGIKDSVVEGKITLLTVEDLYDPNTLEELGKERVLESMVTHKRDPKMNFAAFARSKTYGQPESPITRKFEDTRRVHPRRLLSVGDQPHSDARAGIKVGGYGFVVDGPSRLNDIFSHVKFPKEGEEVPLFEAK